MNAHQRVGVEGHGGAEEGRVHELAASGRRAREERGQDSGAGQQRHGGVGHRHRAGQRLAVVRPGHEPGERLRLEVVPRPPLEGARGAEGGDGATDERRVPGPRVLPAESEPLGHPRAGADVPWTSTPARGCPSGSDSAGRTRGPGTRRRPLRDLRLRRRGPPRGAAGVRPPGAGAHRFHGPGGRRRAAGRPAPVTDTAVPCWPAPGSWPRSSRARRPDAASSWTRPSSAPPWPSTPTRWCAFTTSPDTGSGPSRAPSSGPTARRTAGSRWPPMQSACTELLPGDRAARAPGRAALGRPCGEGGARGRARRHGGSADARAHQRRVGAPARRRRRARRPRARARRALRRPGRPRGGAARRCPTPTCAP